MIGRVNYDLWWNVVGYYVDDIRIFKYFPNQPDVSVCRLPQEWLRKGFTTCIIQLEIDHLARGVPFILGTQCMSAWPDSIYQENFQSNDL